MLADFVEAGEVVLLSFGAGDAEGFHEGFTFPGGFLIRFVKAVIVPAEKGGAGGVEAAGEFGIEGKAKEKFLLGEGADGEGVAYVAGVFGSNVVEMNLHEFSIFS